MLEREGGDTSDLWAEFRALRAKAKRESRRAKAAYWKSRNQTLAELARDPTRAKQFWNVLLQRAASDCADAIELYVRGQNPHCKKQTTADPSEVANLFRDEYAKIGTDSLPPGHSFDIAERARQDAALAAILNLPEHEGPCGASINVREIQEAINKLKYGKASGVDCISTDLLKVFGKGGD